MINTNGLQPAYKNVLLKLSGEAVEGKLDANGNKSILDFDFLADIAQRIKVIVGMGVKLSIVVGGGNIWRGREGRNMDPVRADHMGMLATSINALAIQDTLESAGVRSRTMTAIQMEQCAEFYIRNRAISHLEKGYVVVFGCGTGNPFFSTDTAAVLRAAEIEADVILMAKNIDGVYDCDPKTNPDAKKYDSITYTKILEKNYKVIDSTAASLARDKHLTTLVFGLNDPDNIIRAVCGENIGTVVSE